MMAELGPHLFHTENTDEEMEVGLGKWVPGRRQRASGREIRGGGGY